MALLLILCSHHTHQPENFSCAAHSSLPVLRPACWSACFAAADAQPIAARTGRRARMPRRRQHRLHRRLGDQSRLRAARRGLAGGPLRRAPSARSASTSASPRIAHLPGRVYAPSRRLGPGDLSGSYAGAQGSASVGVGLGGNALVGGSDNSFALQPLSLQGQVGLAVAAGLESLELRPGRCRRRAAIGRRFPAMTCARPGATTTVSGLVMAGRTAACIWRACDAAAATFFRLAKSPSVQGSIQLPTQSRAELQMRRRQWDTTSEVPAVHGASRWWALSKAVRPHFSKPSWRAPAPFPAPAAVEAGTSVGDAVAEARRHKHGRRPDRRHDDVHGRQLHLDRLPGLDRIRP